MDAIFAQPRPSRLGISTTACSPTQGSPVSHSHPPPRSPTSGEPPPRPGRWAGRANVGDKLLSLAMSALAGGDCIDAPTPSGRAGRHRPRSRGPGGSTLGTFLRRFRWGHVLQLDRVSPLKGVKDAVSVQLTFAGVSRRPGSQGRALHLFVRVGPESVLDHPGCGSRHRRQSREWAPGEIRADPRPSS